MGLVCVWSRCCGCCTPHVCGRCVESLRLLCVGCQWIVWDVRGIDVVDKNIVSRAVVTSTSVKFSSDAKAQLSPPLRSEPARRKGIHMYANASVTFTQPPNWVNTYNSFDSSGFLSVRSFHSAQIPLTGLHRQHLRSTRVSREVLPVPLRPCRDWIVSQRQDTQDRLGKTFTTFTDSRAAMERVTSDDPGPGQDMAIQTIDLAYRLVDQGNSVTVRWTAHRG